MDGSRARKQNLKINFQRFIVIDTIKITLKIDGSLSEQLRYQEIEFPIPLGE